MDMEQFKMLIDLLQSAGSGTFSLAVLYIAKGYFGGVMGFLCLWTLLHYVTKWVFTSSFGYKARLAAGIHGAMSQYDTNRMLKAIKDEYAKGRYIK